MTTWADVAGKAIDFVGLPSGASVVKMALALLFLLYVIPMGVVTWASWESTNRLERAINALGEDLRRSAMVSTRR